MSKAPPPDTERLLTAVAGTLLGASVAVWGAGQLAAHLWGGAWLPLSVWDAPRLLVELALRPGDPITALGPRASLLIPGPLPYYAVLGLLLLGAGGAALAGWRWWEARNDTPEAARWARPRDLKPLLVRRPRPGRLTLGRVERRLVATEEQHSVAVIGPSGTGKTTGFAIPALLEWDGPVVATTVKGDLLPNTIARRGRMGEVWVYDPVKSTGEPSAGWSPLRAAWDWQGALRMAAWLVSTARAGDRGGLQDSDFWYAVAQKLLAPLLFAAARSRGTMADVVRWVDLQEEEEPNEILEGAGVPGAHQAFSATMTREERQHSGVYTTAETVLAAFSDPGVLAASTYEPTFDPEQLLDGGNHTLYVCGPPNEQARLRSLFTALIEEVVAAVYERANREETRLVKPLLLVIDEAANIAPLPDLAQLASTARGVGIQLVTVWQDFAQIEARYGIFAQTVINNHRAKVVLAGVSDTSTLDYVSRLIGDERVIEVAETRSGDGSVLSLTRSTRYRPLASPDALRRGDSGTGVLVYGNLHPARMRLRPWHRERALLDLAPRNWSLNAPSKNCKR